MVNLTHHLIFDLMLVFKLSNGYLSSGMFQQFIRTPITRQQSSVFSTNVSKKLRLERIISNRGAGSRKVAGLYLKQGKVAVDGKIVRGGSQLFPIDVKIEIAGEPWYF